MKNSNVSDVSSFQSSLNNLHLIINTIQILSMKEYTTMPWKGTFPKFFPTTIFPPKKFPQLVNKQGEKEFRSKPNPPRSRPPPPILSSNRNEKKERPKERKKERKVVHPSLIPSIGFHRIARSRSVWRGVVARNEANGIKPGLVIPTIQHYVYTHVYDTVCIVRAAREGKWNRRERYAAR